MGKRFSYVVIFLLSDFLLDFVLKGQSPFLKFAAGAIFLLVFFFMGRSLLSQYQTASILFGIFSLAVAYSTFLSTTGIYYSFWFNSLLGLLLVSVLSCILTLKPSLSLRYMSFLTLHGSIFVIAAGLLVNSFWARKCYLPLHRGTEVNYCHPIEHNRILKTREKFPFPLKLLDFRVDYYSRPLVLGVFLRQGDRFKLIRTFELKKGRNYFGLKFQGFGESEAKFDELWGEGEKGRVPLGKISPRGWAYSRQAFPGMIAIVDGKERRFYLPEKGQAIVLPDAVVVIEDFYQEVPGHNPPAELPTLVLRVYSAMGHGKTFLTNDPRGISLGSVHLFYSLSRQMPEILSPEKVFVQEKTAKFYRTEFLYKGKPVELIPFAEPYVAGKFAFRLFRAPSQEREYISIVQVPDRKMKLRVNHPENYGGFLFYQSDYNPSDPDFSGIMAIGEPGSPFLYLGFLLMALGAILTLIYRRRLWS